MNKRNNRHFSFDYIRVISTFGIITCHFLLNYQNFKITGNLLANIFNPIFIILSAFIFGIKWQSNNKTSLHKSFVFERVVRVSCTYYPFLMFMFLFIFLTDGKILEKTDIILHFLHLPVIRRIENWGHLWFISMILFCYVACYLYSKLKIRINSSKTTLMIIGVLCLLGIIIIYNYNISVITYSIIIYLYLYIIVFENASSILKYMEKFKNTKSILTMSLLFIILSTLIQLGNFPHHLINILTGLILAALLFTILHNIFKNRNINRIILTLSNISFEIFLVHHIITIGEYRAMNYITQPYICFIFICTMSIIFGYILNCLSFKNIYKCLTSNSK